MIVWQLPLKLALVIFQSGCMSISYKTLMEVAVIRLDKSIDYMSSFNYCFLGQNVLLLRQCPFCELEENYNHLTFYDDRHNIKAWVDMNTPHKEQSNRKNLPLKRVSYKTRSELSDTLINGPRFGQLFG